MSFAQAVTQRGTGLNSMPYRDPEKRRECKRRWAAEYRKTNPEKYRAAARARYWDNPELLRSRRREYYWKQPEQARKANNARRQSKRWYLSSNRAYRLANPQKAKLWARNNRRRHPETRKNAAIRYEERHPEYRRRANARVVSEMRPAYVRAMISRNTKISPAMWPREFVDTWRLLLQLKRICKPQKTSKN
jgi:hypothetical protein